LDDGASSAEVLRTPTATRGQQQHPVRSEGGEGGGVWHTRKGGGGGSAVTSASWRWTCSGTAPPQTRRAASSDHAAASSSAAAIAGGGGQISLGGPVPLARRPNPLRVAAVACRAREGVGGGDVEASCSTSGAEHAQGTGLSWVRSVGKGEG